MTRRITFVDGLANVITDWTTGTFEFAMVTDGWNPNESVDFFADSFAGSEFVDTGYARQSMTGPTVTIVPPVAAGEPGFIQYFCDNPDFGSLSDGDIAVTLVLIFFVTTDADSPIVATYPIGYTADGTDAEFFISPAGAVTLSTVCPAEFTTWSS